jgi:octanoyl-[GcvH]:protein N-octanoyltransferase
MELVTSSHVSRPARDMELSGELLDAVSRGELPDTARVFRPGPTVAFGRLDRGRDGFERACEVAREHGRVPLVRLGGGHAVAYDPDSVIVELIRRSERSFQALEPHFIELTELIQRALTELGVGLELGELPDEYCPGRFSLHLPAGAKIAGVAQRLRPRASLTTAVIAVAGGEPLRAVTADVYAALGLPLSLDTVGTVAERYPQVSVEQVHQALLERLAS